MWGGLFESAGSTIGAADRLVLKTGSTVVDTISALPVRVGQPGWNLACWDRRGSGILSAALVGGPPRARVGTWGLRPS